MNIKDFLIYFFLFGIVLALIVSLNIPYLSQGLEIIAYVIGIFLFIDIFFYKSKNIDSYSKKINNKLKKTK